MFPAKNGSNSCHLLDQGTDSTQPQNTRVPGPIKRFPICTTCWIWVDYYAQKENNVYRLHKNCSPSNMHLLKWVHSSVPLGPSNETVVPVPTKMVLFYRIYQSQVGNLVLVQNGLLVPNKVYPKILYVYVTQQQLGIVFQFHKKKKKNCFPIYVRYWYEQETRSQPQNRVPGLKKKNGLFVHNF